jgi:hypothetical protein
MSAEALADFGEIRGTDRSLLSRTSAKVLEGKERNNGNNLLGKMPKNVSD